MRLILALLKIFTTRTERRRNKHNIAKKCIKNTNNQLILIKKYNSQDHQNKYELRPHCTRSTE